MLRFLTLFISIKMLYMFQAVPPPIIRSSNRTYSFWYLSNYAATCCYYGWAGTAVEQQFHPNHDSSNLTNTRSSMYNLSSWWWAEEPPETCSVFIEINRVRKHSILLVALWEYTEDVRTYEYKKILKFLINNVQKLKYPCIRLLNVTSKTLLLIALYLTMWTLALIKQEEQRVLHCLLSHQMAWVNTDVCCPIKRCAHAYTNISKNFIM
jgi:hypothetical protein